MPQRNGGGVMVWSEIGNGDHEDIRMGLCNSLSGVLPYTATVGEQYLCMNDYARPH